MSHLELLCLCYVIVTLLHHCELLKEQLWWNERDGKTVVGSNVRTYAARKFYFSGIYKMKLRLETSL